MAGLAEAMAALASATEPTPVPLCGEVVRVKPPMEWRQSAMSAVRQGDFNTWAGQVLVNDLKTVKHKDGTESEKGSDDFAVWLRVDPTNGEVGKFFNAYAAAAGMHPGK